MDLSSISFIVGPFAGRLLFYDTMAQSLKITAIKEAKSHFKFINVLIVDKL